MMAHVTCLIPEQYTVEAHQILFKVKGCEEPKLGNYTIAVYNQTAHSRHTTIQKIAYIVNGASGSDPSQKIKVHENTKHTIRMKVGIQLSR